ncbi:MAG: hypothetical protein JRN37_06555 [Nitrososphaerota archaeon]|jgi:predicted transport protein|nr:hypothetical protein [Nitrososphaerota archaeon]MDG7038797.1 hypothetical protein [Nitrososphaerota archaeon]
MKSDIEIMQKIIRLRKEIKVMEKEDEKEMAKYQYKVGIIPIPMRDSEIRMDRLKIEELMWVLT